MLKKFISIIWRTLVIRLLKVMDKIRVTVIL